MTVAEVISVIDQNKNQLGITLYPPATVIEINNFEQVLDIQLPDDIKEFYQFCNGFESQEDMFRIIPLNEILENKEELTSNYFYIAEYLIYSDTWAVSLISNNEYNICEDSFKTILTDSFAEFLNRFIKGGVFEKEGLYPWRNEILEFRNNKEDQS